MEKAKKEILRLGRLKWLCFLPAGIMFVWTRAAFGTMISSILAAVFGIAFVKICSRGKRTIICEEIIKDMKAGLDKAGFYDTVFEIKSLNIGLVVRVYLIRAKNKAEVCSRIVADMMENGWYKEHIWLTQVVDIEGAESLLEARRALNDALIEDIKEKTERR